MISEKRFGRLEDKVDEIKEDISALNLDIRDFSGQIKRHIEGDEKIITELVPVIHQLKVFLEVDLPKLRELTLEKAVKVHIEKESFIQKNKWKLNLTIVGSLVSIVVALAKLGFIKI